MSRRVVIFILGVLAGLLVVPATNLFLTPAGKAVDWIDGKALLKIDFLRGAIAGWVSPFGISIAPGQVVIGRNRWLFLGDDYESTVTVDRRTATPADAALGRKVQAATAAWEAYLADRGVRSFKVIVGPNKGTIYPERLPDWMRGPPPRVFDAFLAGAGPAYVDVRQDLLDARDDFAAPLYYRTDTHWNLLGAGVAFQRLAADMARSAPDIVWPDQEMYTQVGTSARTGGDMTAFLHRTAATAEIEPRVAIQGAPVTTVRTDWESGERLFVGPNAEVPMSFDPVLVHADGALNQARVLWLRDSFGTALSPYISATFSDVLQVHWATGLAPGAMDDLVSRWKPDHVLVTVVERGARNAAFAALPPVDSVDSALSVASLLPTLPAWVHQLDAGASPDEFVVAGPDPYAVFDLSASAAGASHLRIDLTCLDGRDPVPLQMFWSTRQLPDFDEGRSVRFVHDPARPSIGIGSTGMAFDLVDMFRVRVDIDQGAGCSRFRLEPPAFGTVEQPVEAVTR